jgi:hypothetical protein
VYTAVYTAGSWWGWGRNHRGQLGIGDLFNTNEPTVALLYFLYFPLPCFTLLYFALLCFIKALGVGDLTNILVISSYLFDTYEPQCIPKILKFPPTSGSGRSSAPSASQHDAPAQVCVCVCVCVCVWCTALVEP